MPLDIAVGDELPPLVVEPISQTTLALFAGASGDHKLDGKVDGGGFFG